MVAICIALDLKSFILPSEIFYGLQLHLYIQFQYLEVLFFDLWVPVLFPLETSLIFVVNQLQNFFCCCYQTSPDDIFWDKQFRTRLQWGLLISGLSSLRWSNFLWGQFPASHQRSSSGIVLLCPGLQAFWCQTSSGAQI